MEEDENNRTAKLMDDNAFKLQVEDLKKEREQLEFTKKQNELIKSEIKAKSNTITDLNKHGKIK